MTKNIIIENISEIVTPLGTKGVKGKAMGDLKTYNDHTIVVEKGKIVAITNDASIVDAYKAKAYEVLNGQGCFATPGYIDSHTHLVFGGYRPDEFDMRLKGIPYMEIMKKGGGIANSVKMTRETSLEHLIAEGKKRLQKMMAMGVTTVEAKSGYGLDLDTEIKQLKAIKALKNISELDIVSTFLGAHAVPKDQTATSFITYLNETVLPVVKSEALATFVDIFCEDHVFGIEESRRHLKAAKDLGFKVKLHADEIVSLGGAELAAEMDAISADHLLNISPQGIKDLSKNAIVATLLPGTAFALREEYAPARALIDEGCVVALATDFNPGSCFTYAIPLIISLATLQMHMTIEEVITGLTLNAAAALDLAETHGSIEIGKQADILLHDFPSYKFLGYHIGINTVKYVVKNGVLIHENA